MKQYVFVVLLTAGLTMMLSWTVWRLSLRYKLHPAIRDRDVHTTPTPRLGGVAMFLGVLAAFAVSSQQPFFAIFWADPVPVLSILVATLLIVVIGVLDDLYDLDWMLKLGAQFLAAGIIAGFGGFQIYAVPVGGVTVVSGWVSFTLTVFAIVVVMNAVNFIDGLDGLVAGVCLIGNAIFFAWAYLFARDTNASTYFNLASFIAVVLVGACAGFLVFNWNPAKLFMGDAGALMVGLLMATSAIAVTGYLDPAILGDNNQFGRSQLLGAFIPILLPVVAVILPLLDFGLAVIRRMAAGKSPFSPDRKHLHHRMLDMGHSDLGAVLIFYAWTAVIGIAVLLMYIGTSDDWVGQYLPGVAFGVVGVAACLVVTLVPSKGRMTRRAARPEPATHPMPSSVSDAHPQSVVTPEARP